MLQARLLQARPPLDLHRRQPSARNARPSLPRGDVPSWQRLQQMMPAEVLAALGLESATAASLICRPRRRQASLLRQRLQKVQRQHVTTIVLAAALRQRLPVLAPRGCWASASEGLTARARSSKVLGVGK